MKMVIDSGASSNVVDKGLWSELKQQKMACVSKKCDKRLYAYGSKELLKVLGTFLVSTKVAENEVQAEFVVIDGEGEALLGRETVEVRCSSLYTTVQRSDHVRLQRSV